MMSSDEGWLLPGSVKDSQSSDRLWRRVGAPLIDGVVEHELRTINTGYGRLLETCREDWLSSPCAVRQVFCAGLRPGSISAWHAHARTTDRITVIAGSIRLVLYDARPGSPTCGRLNEFRLSEQRTAMILIPPRVWHGLQNTGLGEAIISNAVDHAYDYEDPDHHRLPPDSDQVPFRFMP